MPSAIVLHLPEHAPVSIGHVLPEKASRQGCLVRRLILEKELCHPATPLDDAGRRRTLVNFKVRASVLCNPLTKSANGVGLPSEQESEIQEKRFGASIQR